MIRIDYCFIVVICILLLLFWYKKSQSEIDGVQLIQEKIEKWTVTPRVAILLTMYTGQNHERRKMYEENIRDWLRTGLDIYSVDSSGQQYNIPKLRHYCFVQKESDGSSSVKEKTSIQYVLHRVDFSDYDLLFKVTGKYYTPNFVKMLRYIPLDTKVVFQNKHSGRSSQNSELVGVKPAFWPIVLSFIDNNTIFEEALIPIPKMYRTYRLPPLQIARKTKRGDGQILEYL